MLEEVRSEKLEEIICNEVGAEDLGVPKELEETAWTRGGEGRKGAENKCARMRNKVQVRKCEEDVTGGKNQWVRERNRETGLDKKRGSGRLEDR